MGDSDRRFNGGGPASNGGTGCEGDGAGGILTFGGAWDRGAKPTGKDACRTWGIQIGGSTAGARHRTEALVVKEMAPAASSPSAERGTAVQNQQARMPVVHGVFRSEVQRRGPGIERRHWL